ncbi:FAD-dependent oxidoreductase [Rhizobium sp. ICMP 5592]|uniref:NAD(P)/FAD-dependent oxidoreductase n=1 Tax=Rhizobium sp. ICMP 5592 TaxID=2292445 RepID=UPI00129656F9|nr:FAD-dependent oxidoreductase [Rhizobium sp. ICMP 5592]MQB46101.1 ferredoxin--NAD+ reductase [Rhizobium sp. ICMP 5592]
MSIGIGQIVIVGAGQAGAKAATSLRSAGYKGRLTLVGAEPHLPYERPQLSKSALETAQATVKPIMSEVDFDAAHIELKLGLEITGIHRDQKHVVAATGEVIPYDVLILAVGGTARSLTALQCDNRRLFQIRTADDANALNRALENAGSMLVVGGGWLGLEVAASARNRGLEVVVIEAGPRLCGRAAPPEVSRYLLDLHQAQGVRVIVDAGLASIDASADGVAANLSNGESFATDIAVLAIGLQPNLALASLAGLEVDKGILADKYSRTIDPNIYAIGDCAEAFHPHYGVRMRLESWQNANCQAEIAAAAIIGSEVPEVPQPWFWSDQYDRSLQMLGDVSEARTRCLRGSVDGAFSILFLDGDKLSGIVSINTPRDVGMARKLLGVQVDLSLASNASIPLSKARCLQP